MELERVWDVAAGMMASPEALVVQNPPSALCSISTRSRKCSDATSLKRNDYDRNRKGTDAGECASAAGACGYLLERWCEFASSHVDGRDEAVSFHFREARGCSG